MNFSENLRELRKKQDIKQEALAESLNVSRQTVSKWENGTAMPDLKRLTELADYFGVSMDELLGTKLDTSGDENTVKEEYEKTVFNELYKEELNAIEKRYENATKRQMASIIIFGLIVIAALVILYMQFSNLNDRMTTFQNNVNLTLADYQNNNEETDEKTIADDFSYKILSQDKDKPYLAKVRFTYAPSSYSKSAEVSFSVPQSDGKTKKVKAEESDGKFIAEEEIDLTAKGDYKLILSDDATNQNAVVTPYFLGDFFSGDTNGGGDLSINGKGQIVFSNEDAYSPIFQIFSGDKIKSAELSMRFKDGKTLDAKEINTELSGDSSSDSETYFVYLATLTSQSIINDNNANEYYGKKIIISYVLTGESGINYSLNTEYTLGEGSDSEGDTVSRIDFGDGKTIDNSENAV